MNIIKTKAKKTTALLLAAFVAFSFSACSFPNVSEIINKSTTESTQTTEEQTSETQIQTTESTSESRTEKLTIDNVVTESTSATEKASSEKIKNGTLVEEDGITYIIDDETGVKFLIVNKTYSIPKTYAPGKLTDECSKAFSRLCAAAKNDGLSIYSISGFRSYERRNELYTNYSARDGKAAADRYSARPGHSEHQTGLAIDCNSLSSSFENTAEGKWLKRHCTEYGFIIRFEKGKESSTGYMFEPWHIRFLGSADLATKIASSGLSVEEYYNLTSSYKK